MSYTSNNPRIISQQYRPQSADPANPLEGQVFRADGTSRATGLWEYQNGAWIPLASSTGGLDVAFQLQGNENLSTWSNGNNAAFLGGGALAGTFAYNTSSPLNGNRDYSYTQAAGSLNDYLASPVQNISSKFRGNQATFIFNYNYNGASSDLQFVVYDVTNATVLTIPQDNFIPVSSTTSTLYKVNVFIPSTCAQIRVGYQVKALNSGKILRFDDIVMSADVTRYTNLTNNTDWTSYTPTILGYGTVSGTSFFWRRLGDSIEVQGKFTTGTPSAVIASFSLPNSYLTDSVKMPSIRHVGTYFNQNGGGRLDKGGAILATPSVNAINFGDISSFGASSSSTPLTAKLGNALSVSGDVISINATIPIQGWTTTNLQIVTASESFSTDTAQLVYAPSSTYTISTLANAPVGTFITFTYAASGNVRTQTTTAPTQTTSSMNQNGIQLFTRAYNAASTAASPSVVAIQIGKKLKGNQLSLYKSSSKVTSGSIDNIVQNTTVEFGITHKSYDELTGILYIDMGVASLTTNTSRSLIFTDLTSANNGYIVINASKNPALVGIGASTVAARAVQSSGQSIPNSVETVVTYDAAKTFDLNGALNTGTGVYVVQTAGYYSIQGKITFNNGTTGERYGYIRVDSNFFGIAAGAIRSPGSASNSSVTFNDLLFLTPGQQVYLTAFQSSGGALALKTNPSENYFAIAKVSI